MPVRFILGRAGSGKTAWCLEAIRAELRRSSEGPPLLFLVPEQATFTMERAILAGADAAATCRAHVLSFRRLALRSLKEVGGAAHPPIGPLGKAMLLAAILQEEGGWQLLGRAARTPGLVRQLMGTLKELQAYRVDWQALEATCRALARKGEGETALAAKLSDLAQLQRALRARLEGRFSDPDELLTVASRRIAKWPFLRGARLFVDGFAGFTPEELAVLGILLRTVERADIALCLDPERADEPLHEADLFHPTQTTYQQLKAVAAAAGVAIEPPVHLAAAPPRRFARSAALAALEAALAAKRDTSRPRAARAGEAIRLCAAADRRAEVEAAAREIVRLCRDEGYRFREIGVIVWDLDPYAELIHAVFTDLGIPHFIDRKESVLHHPLVELLCAALECVSLNWPYEAVSRCWKTDLIPVGRAVIDELENYVLSHGIRGRNQYARPWRFGPRDGLQRGRSDRSDAGLDRLNAAREAAVRDLLAFHRAIGGQRTTVKTISAALWDLLQSLDVPATLTRWAEEAQASGDLVG
ncbi:MAG TPA: helicase-exonuclease AddAB subunit AddB, partial [Limnochordia bacterium]